MTHYIDLTLQGLGAAYAVLTFLGAVLPQSWKATQFCKRAGGSIRKAERELGTL